MAVPFFNIWSGGEKARNRSLTKYGTPPVTFHTVPDRSLIYTFGTTYKHNRFIQSAP